MNAKLGSAITVSSLDVIQISNRGSQYSMLFSLFDYRSNKEITNNPAG